MQHHQPSTRQHHRRPLYKSPHSGQIYVSAMTTATALQPPWSKLCTGPVIAPLRRRGKAVSTRGAHKNAQQETPKARPVVYWKLIFCAKTKQEELLLRAAMALVYPSEQKVASQKIIPGHLVKFFKISRSWRPLFVTSSTFTVRSLVLPEQDGGEGA